MNAYMPIVKTFIITIIFMVSACENKTADTSTTNSQAAASHAPSSNAVVNIYSYRKEALIKPVLDKFTQRSGIKVNLVTGKADALLQRLKSEGANSPADLLITSDVGRLYRAKQAGLLQAIDSKLLQENIPAQLKDPDNTWFGLSQRARVIFYNNEKVKADQLSTYEDLANEQWKGKICIRSSSNIYNQSLLASFIAHHGEEKALQWSKAIVANMARAPKGNDRDQLKAAALGACDIAIANTYYFGLWLVSDDPQVKQYSKQLNVFFPNQTDRGAHINISGAGVTKHAKNKVNAVKLLEYLSSIDAQNFYAQVNHEYPVNPHATISQLVKSWGYPFKMDTLSVSNLGVHNSQAIKLFDRAGWK